MSNLTRRHLLTTAALLPMAYGISGMSSCNLQTLAPAIVDYVTNTAGALLNSLSSIASLSGLPAGWSATFAQITSWVTAIKAIASGITTSTLVSTAGGDVSSLITDFNQIVQSIIANPVVATLVSGTGFGWALSLASILLPLVGQAVQVVINVLSPPAPAPIAPPVAAHRLMTARLAAPLDPATANEILHAIAVGKFGG